MQTSTAVHGQVDAEPDPARERSRARSFGLAALAGAVPAVAVFVWFVNSGRTNLFQRLPLGDFYDLQVRSFFRGHLALPKGSLGVEGIVIHGRTYEYYGPFPAFLRMPVLAFTHSFDGRLTQISMALAFVVALFGATRLLWRAREVVRPAAPWSRREGVLVAVWTFALGAGSALLFPASRGFIYHEAEIWGGALALVAFDAVIGAARDTTRGRVALAALLSTCALLTRASIGLGPPVALGFLALLGLWRLLRHDRDARRTWRMVAAFGVAAIVPVVAYALLNHAKFGTWFSVPLDKQVFSRFNPSREAALRANGGSLFNIEYLPSTIWQYVRPDALRLMHLFPFLDFPLRKPSVFLGVRFDTLDRSSSVVATMPALVLLAVVGVVRLTRRRPTSDVALVWTACIAGACVAVLPTLAIGFIANRYLIDFLPIVLLPAVLGVQWCFHALDRARHPRRPWHVAVGALVVLLVAFGLWANVGLTLTSQRLWGAPPPVLRGFVGTQESLGSALGTGGYRVIHVDRLATPPPHDTLAVVGACDALYWADPRFVWRPLEIGPAIHVLAHVRFSSGDPTGTPTPLAIMPGSDRYEVTVTGTTGGELRFGVRDAQGHQVVGRAVAVPRDRTVDAGIVLDRALRTTTVTVDGHDVLKAADQTIPPGAVQTVVPAPGGNGLVRSVRPLPVRTPLCDRVRGG